MEALHAQNADTRFDVFTTVPEGLFADSLEGLFDYHRCESDVGLRQTSPFEYDVAATRAAVEAYMSRAPSEAEALGARLRALGCAAVVSDISPLGLMAASAADLPSVLIENFTWDWLYEPLVAEDPAFGPIVAWMRARFEAAGRRIHTRPGCDPLAEADLVVDPISRSPRRSRADVRAEFEVAEDDRFVLITMGGVTQQLPFLEELRRRDDVTFALTGTGRTAHEGNVWYFQLTDRVFLPDLVQAADLVVAKLGHATVAEVWSAGRPLAYIGREGFRETGPLRDFVETETPCQEIVEADFSSGRWIARLDELLALKSAPAKPTNGSEAATRLILETVAGA